MSRAVQTMFDEISGRYDRLNRLLSAGRDLAWRRKAVAMLPSLGGGGRPARVLDLCGGTGDFTAALRQWERGQSERAGVRTQCVIGDFSRPMLALSFSKGLNAPAVALDALRPPLKPGSFDAVLCGFGMRNLDDTAAGVRAVRDLLTPDGTFVTLEFFRPEGLFARFFYGALAPVFIPFAGAALGSRRTAYEYLVQSVRRFRTAKEYAALCRAQGFGDTRIRALDGGIAHIVIARVTARKNFNG
jgi:demethylmenaquinone methyltransferase/2-methoxy-6-polyprenyl-1,4-benzoquinol methylase